MKKRILAALLITPALAWADARTPAVLLPASAGGTPIVATAGDHSVALTVAQANTSLDLWISDGRGVSWSAPLAVDPPASNDWIGFRRAAVVGDKAYVVWTDDRNAQAPLWSLVATTAFVRVFDLPTATAGPELVVPTGTLPTHTATGVSDFVALEVAGAVHLHLAARQNVLDSVTGLIQRQVVLFSSHDGGSTWLAPLAITPLGPESYGDVRVVASGNHVHVLYTDSTFFVQPQLFDQRSLDGGQTADFAQPVAVPGAYEAWNFDVDLDGSLLAIAFENFAADFAYSSATAITSRDGGLTYENPGGFGVPGLFVDQSFVPRIAVLPGTQDVIATAAATELFGGSLIVGVHTANGGVTWLDQSLLAQGTVKSPEVVTSEAGRDRVTIAWIDGFGFSGLIQAAVSFDRGAQFEAPIGLTTTATSWFSMVWNELYENALLGFGDTAGLKPQSVGGFRPQQIALSGFVGGSSSVSASFEGFDGGADLAWLLLSTDTASQPLPLGDGRELGVGPTPLFASLLPLALGGLFAAPLAPDGSGSMAPLPISAPGVPPGLMLFAVGLSFDFASASFVDITDVVDVGT